MNKLSFSASALKLVACITMVIDHVGLLFFPENLLWRVVGRISFPIFAFLIAEGYDKTRSRRNYFVRLLGFAAISHIPFVLFTMASGSEVIGLNIFFTLSAGLLALIIWDRLPRAVSIVSIGSILALAHYLSFDYGAYGIITVLTSRLFLRSKVVGTGALLLLPQLQAALRFISGSSIQNFASMSVPLIALYNGQRGLPLPRWFFYAFYPGHLLLLWLISLFVLN